MAAEEPVEAAHAKQGCRGDQPALRRIQRLLSPLAGSPDGLLLRLFPEGQEGIDEAQENKLDHICRKLRLARGDHLLDVGCGWGGHVGSLVTNPLPFALFATLGRVPYAWTLVAVALICRSALLQTVARHFGMARQRFQLVPFCDLSLFVVFLVSFCGSTVEWRVHLFRSRPDGSLVAKKDLTPA